MRYIKRFNGFLIKEAAGLAEPTLLYSDFIMELAQKHLDEFLNTTELTYKKVESIDITKVKNIFTTSSWVSLPVSTLNISFNFNRRTDEQFTKEFPVTSKIKNFTTTGFCSGIEKEKTEDSSYIEPSVDERTDHSIFLNMEIGCLINESFNEVEDLLLEMESATLHELNHGYENYRRMINGAGQLSTDVTWSLEANRSRIKKEIFKAWSDKIGYYIYWSEKHEMNAMVQDAWPYVKKYHVEELKSKCPTWTFAQRMIDFNSVDFKKQMSDLINSFYPDVNPEIILNRMKNGLANQLDQSRETSVIELVDAPSIKGIDIRKMSIDKFLQFVQDRVNSSGQRIQKKILKLYSLKK